MSDDNEYELPEWETPDSYFGFSPVGDYLIYSKHRDSDVLMNTNYELIKEDLEKLEAETVCYIETADDSAYDERSGSFVYDWRANHFAVGWVDYLMLRRDAPEHLQQAVYEILAGLADYPVYDDEAFSEAEIDDQESTFDFSVSSEVSKHLQREPDPLDPDNDMRDLDDAVGDTLIDLREVFNEVAEENNIYWYTIDGGQWIDYEAVMPHLIPRLILMVKEENGEDDLVPESQWEDFYDEEAE